MAVDFPDNRKRIEIYKEAADLRSKLGQSERALANLKIAGGIDPEDDTIKTQIIFEKFKAGCQKRSWCRAKSRFLAGKRDWETVSILLSAQVENPNLDLRTELIKEIENTAIPGKQIYGNGKIILLGFSGDGWTLDGNPGCLLVKGAGESGNAQKYFSDVMPDKEHLPLTVTIADGNINKAILSVRQNA